MFNCRSQGVVCSRYTCFQYNLYKRATSTFVTGFVQEIHPSQGRLRTGWYTMGENNTCFSRVVANLPAQDLRVFSACFTAFTPAITAAILLPGYFLVVYERIDRVEQDSWMIFSGKNPAGLCRSGGHHGLFAMRINSLPFCLWWLLVLVWFQGGHFRKL